MRTITAVDVRTTQQGADITVVTPKVAIEIMQQALAARAADGFVSNAPKRSQWNATNRRALANVEEDKQELSDIDARISRLSDTIAKRAKVPRLRWRWAFLCVLRGAFPTLGDVNDPLDRLALLDLHDCVRRTAPRIAERMERRFELDAQEDDVREMKRVAAHEEASIIALDRTHNGKRRAGSDQKVRKGFRDGYLKALHMNQMDLVSLGFDKADEAVGFSARAIKHVEIRQALYRQYCAERFVRQHNKACTQMNRNFAVPGSTMKRIASAAVRSALKSTGVLAPADAGIGHKKYAPRAYHVTGNRDVRGIYHRIHHSTQFGEVYVSPNRVFLFEHNDAWHLGRTNPLLFFLAKHSDAEADQAALPEASVAADSDVELRGEDLYPAMMSCSVFHAGEKSTWQKRKGERFVNIATSSGDVIISGDHTTLAYEPSIIEQKAAKAAVERRKLAAYADVIRKRISASEDARERIEAMTQSRFEVLHAMASGSAAPSCAICFEDEMIRPVLTRCVHMFCFDCMKKHTEARRVLGAADDQNQCPFCRQPFHPRELLEIDTSSAGHAESEAGPAAEDPMVVEHVLAKDDEGDDEWRPRYSSASTTEEFETMPLPDGVTPYMDARYAAVSGRAIARLYQWTNVVPEVDASYVRKVYGSKVSMVADDVLYALRDDPSAKIVIMTTMRVVIPHVVHALSHVRVKSVQIDRPHATAEQEAALTDFKSCDDGAASVLVLLAGVASAGLTLTCAQHMFLLEPFFRRGEELQAINRCHRIGQDRPVLVTTYFCGQTMEERLLAYRDVERDDMSSVLKDVNADDSRGLSSAKAQFILGLKP